MLWDWDGTLERIHHALYVATREREGRKRHILVDTLGLLLNVVVHPADVQDRDGARFVLYRRTRCLFPFIVISIRRGHRRRLTFSSRASSPMPAIRGRTPRERLPALVVGCWR